MMPPRYFSGVLQQNYTTGSTATVTVADQVWPWNYYNTATSSDIDYSWISWNRLYASIISRQAFGGYPAPAEIVEREARQVAREREAQVQQAKRVKAIDLATRLLMDQLDGEQRRSLEQTRYFDVLSRDGLRRYRIHHGRAGNVKLLGPDGQPAESFCIHPLIACPDEDTMLAQKFLIEADEKRFLETANRTVYGRRTA